MLYRYTAKTITSACLIVAAIALASPAAADPVSCDSAEARDVMINTLRQAGDDHPVDVTFRTRAEGVELPAYLLAQYPDEMDIILQYQFERLVVRNERIAVNGLYRHGFLLAPALAELTLGYVARGTIDNEVMQCA